MPGGNPVVTSSALGYSVSGGPRTTSETRTTFNDKDYKEDYLYVRTADLRE